MVQEEIPKKLEGTAWPYSSEEGKGWPFMREQRTAAVGPVAGAEGRAQVLLQGTKAGDGGGRSRADRRNDACGSAPVGRRSRPQDSRNGCDQVHSPECRTEMEACRWRQGSQQSALSPPTCRNSNKFLTTHMCRNSKKLWKTHMQSLLTNIVKPVTCSQCMSAIVSDRILRTRHNKLKRCGKQRGPAVVTRRKSGEKPQDVVGYQNGLLCSQVLLFSGKSGTLLQQDAIGMRKVSGFALFAIKSHRVCSFSKNGTEGAKKQKAGLIPQYPLLRTRCCLSKTGTM